VREGKGERPKPGDVLELDYSLWSKDGRLLDTSFRRGARISGKLDQLKLPFLKEIPPLLRPGGVCLCEVPKALGFGDDVPQQFGDLGPDGVTIWEIELSAVHEPLPTPAFAMPAEDELRRTPRGLGYQVLRAGQGEPPSPWQTVTVHYAGWKADGTLFDSSYERGVPLTTRLDGVILGWHLGLQMMKPGAVYKFVFPPELAYGERGDPSGRIGPDETLLFQVELLRVGR